MPAHQQINVNLDPDLVRQVKHHAIDTQQSVSELVAQALHQHLTQEPSMADTSPADVVLSLQPMVHVQQMAPAIAFYEALGGSVLHGSRDGDFVMMRIGNCQLGLLAHPPSPQQNQGLVELNFETTQGLEVLEQRLREVGVTIAQPATDEAFGAQLQVRTPDGLLVKINHLDQDLYT